MAKKRSRSHRPRPPGGKPAPASRPDVQPTSDGDIPATGAKQGRARDPRGRQERRRDARRAEADPRAADRGRETPTVRAPAFWFGFEVTWAKLVTARLLVFGLLALDAFLQIRQAPRYAGDFNIAQLPLLDGLGPGRLGYAIGQLVETYLFVLVALGIATRFVLPVATAIYAWLYLGSQLDWYQHHYLVVLVLGIGCFVPWQRPKDATPATRVGTWAIRLVLVQLAIVYLWAAISKLDAAWLDGRTLARVVTGALRTAIDRTIGISAVSVLVVVAELTLAATVWLRPAWRIAAPLGIALHLGILSTGLETGLFAHVMLGLYVLVLPDALLVWLARSAPVRAIAACVDRIARVPAPAALGAAVAIGLALAWSVRVEHAFVVAIGLSLVPIAIAAFARSHEGASPGAIGAAHVAALVLWLAADRATSVAADNLHVRSDSPHDLLARTAPGDGDPEQP